MAATVAERVRRCRARRRARQVCVECGKEPTQGRRRCDSCSAKKVAAVKQKYDTDGPKQCSHCGHMSPPRTPGRRCALCAWLNQALCALADNGSYPRGTCRRPAAFYEQLRQAMRAGSMPNMPGAMLQEVVQWAEQNPTLTLGQLKELAGPRPRWLDEAR